MVKKQDTRRKKAMDPDQRENQIVDLAYDLAEQQLIDGTASSSVITHFLKLGTERAKLEGVMMSKQSELLTAKASSIQSAQANNDIADKALSAFKNYQPSAD